MSTIPTQNPVPSEAPRDLKFNAEKIDEIVTSNNQFYIDRFGEKHYTIYGIEYLSKQAMLNYGYITKRSFELGNTLINPNDVLLWESEGEYYRWDGELPKVVSAGSSPESAGGVGKGKFVQVGGAVVNEYSVMTNKQLNIIQDGQLRIGTGKVASASNKDTLLLAREIRGMSDRHGFRDESILDEIVDYGGYGSVDVATTFRGTGMNENGFDHHYAFQNRFNWEGSTNIGTIGGLLNRVNLTGTGTVQRILEVSIEDYKGSSPVREHYGIRMRPLDKAEKNYSLVSEGANTHMIHAGIAAFGHPLVAPSGESGIKFGGATLKGTKQTGIESSGIANSDAAASYIAFLAKCSVLAGVKLPDAYGLKIENGGKGAGSEIERMTGIMIDALNSGLSNRGIQSLVPAGENNWNLFLHGAAKNYIAGNLGIGDHATTRNPTARVHINGGTKDTPPLKINTGTVTEAPQNGAFEFDGTNLFFTVGGVRKKVMLQ